jgi:hypothetical protein
MAGFELTLKTKSILSQRQALPRGDNVSFRTGGAYGALPRVGTVAREKALYYQFDC